MKRSLIARGASVLALTIAVGIAAPAFAKDPALAKDHTSAEKTVATPTMSFGEWGVDPASLDPSIDPGDDFFAYVNAKWLADNPLPPEFSRFGAFDLLREKSTTDVKALVDELSAPGVELTLQQQRVMDDYNAYLDTDAIEVAGLRHVNPYLNAINGAESLSDLIALWAMPGYPSMLSAYVSVDQKQPDSYTVYIRLAGLGMPDRQYYLDESEKGRDIQQKYHNYLGFMLKEAGYDEPATVADTIYGFEDWAARNIAWDRAVQRNRDLTYSAVTKDELIAMAGEFPILEALKQTGLDKSDKFVLVQVPPSKEEAEALGLSEEVQAKIGTGVPGLFKMLKETNLQTLKAWTIAQFLSQNADVLPKRFDDARFAFYGQTLSGQPEQRPRWKRAIAETESHLGEVVGKTYVARYFPRENKAAMDQLVANLRTALAQSIDEIDWMSAETKTEARTKLASFDPKIGYRENLETYPGLTINKADPLANRMAADRWEMADNVAKLGQPIDRTEWAMLPQTVNAYYNPSKNEIVFPAAILQQPFFGINADIAVNYGAIGGVIGHEMGHGFDDQGSKSDGTGKLRNWWTDSDRKAFDALGNALVAQYNAYCPLDDGKTCVNGRLTLGENIGDLGGLSLAYRAYKTVTAGQDVPVIDGLTGDQRFFLSWAQVWRSEQREDNARKRLRADPHSPEKFRVNGIVRNMDAWYKAFNVTEDDALYLPPEERVRIW